MQASHDQARTTPVPVAVAPNLSDATTNAIYRNLGVALAAGISAAFWIAALGFALPALNITPSSIGLALTGLSIACVVSAALVALRAPVQDRL